MNDTHRNKDPLDLLTQVNVAVPVRTIQRINNYADDRGVPKAEVIRQALAEFLENHRNDPVDPEVLKRLREVTRQKRGGE